MLACAPGEARPPTGEIVLDIADLVVAATVAGVKLRLRVAIDGKDFVELNPAAAARLPVVFGGGFTAEVGRVALPGKGAVAEVAIAGRRFPAELATHGRDCCAGVDGAIPPGLLPYARVRFVRAGAPPGSAGRTLAMAAADDGLEYIDPAEPKLRVRFSLERPESIATSSAGAILAAAHHGRLAGGYEDVAAAFGVMRPTQMLTLSPPAALAGFAFDRLRVRVADYGGRYELPRDPGAPGDIVVRKRVARQEALPVVVIGRDRLGRCAEIVFETATRRLTLRCSSE